MRDPSLTHRVMSIPRNPHPLKHIVLQCPAIAIPFVGQPPIMPSQIADLHPFRQDFIRNFQRIAKNTTPGDAQFLRILIESSGAKRGLEIGTATGYGAWSWGWGSSRPAGT